MLQRDKIYHAMVGTIIFVITSLFVSEIQAYIFVVAFAVGKEIWDFRHKGHVASLLDFLATIVIPTLLMGYIFYKYF